MTTVVEIPTQVEAQPQTLAVVVTHEDIACGTPASSSTCGVAQALYRMGASKVVVGPYMFGKGAVVWIDNREYRCAAMGPWIRQFDRDKSKCHPERFVLTPVATAAQSQTKTGR